MHNVITANANLSILERAIKGRNRRDRDGKNRRPVTDALIEMVAELESRVVSAEASAASLRLDAEVLRDVVAKQSAAIDAMEAEAAALNAPATIEAAETVEQPA